MPHQFTSMFYLCCEPLRHSLVVNPACINTYINKEIQSGDILAHQSQ